MTVLTAEEIAAAKEYTKYRVVPENPVHEHDDCIRIAYEWLDAQTIVNGRMRPMALKHIIEKWGGRYVSQNDVEVAAALHPRIKGEYPRYNISARLVRPAEKRLATIGQANTQMNYKRASTEFVYARFEDHGDGRVALANAGHGMRRDYEDE